MVRASMIGGRKKPGTGELEDAICDLKYISPPSKVGFLGSADWNSSIIRIWSMIEMIFPAHSRRYCRDERSSGYEKQASLFANNRRRMTFPLPIRDGNLH